MADGKVVIKIDGDDSGFKNSISGLGKVATAGLAAATAAAAGLTAGFVAAVKVGAAFEAQVSTVGSISGASAEEMARLTAKAEEMGAKTAFSAAEAGKAFEYMAMAGWKTEEMLSGVSGIMNLAAASGEDLGMVADIVTDGLTAFGLSADQSARFSDVLAASASNSNTNVSMLGESFKYVAPVAGALGYSIEDTATALGLMANAGIKGSQAGTALRSTMSRLTKPTEDVQVALNKLNISMTDSNGKVKPLDTLIGELRTSFSGLTEAEKAQYAATIAGQEGMSGLLAIVNASETDFNKLKSAIENSAGEAEKMAEIRMDNLQGQVTLLKSSLEGTGIAVYKKFAEPMKNGVKSAIVSVNSLTSSITKGGLGNALEGLGKQVGNLIADFAKFATKALPPLINGFTFLVKHIGALTKTVVAAVAAFKTFSIVNKVINMMTSLNTAMTLAGVSTKITTAAQLAKVTADQAEAVSAGLATTALTTKGVVLGVLTGKISLAAAAQHLFNAALWANPAGIMTAAIVGLTVAFGAWVIMSDQATEEEKARQEAIDKTIQKTDELTEAVKEQKEAYQQNIETITETADAKLLELDKTEALAKELENLADKNGKVAEADKDRATFILNELNEALGTEYKLTGNQIKNYDKLTDDVYKLIKAEKARTISQAYQEMYAEALKNEAEQKRKAREATEELLLQEQKRAEVLESVRKKIEEATGQTISLEEAQAALGDGYSVVSQGVRINLKEEQKQYDELGISIEHNQKIAEEYGKARIESSELKKEADIIKTELLKGNYDAVTNKAQISAQARLDTLKQNGGDILAEIEVNNAEILRLEELKNQAQSEAEKLAYDTMLTERKEYDVALQKELASSNSTLEITQQEHLTTTLNNLNTSLNNQLSKVSGNKAEEQRVLSGHYNVAKSLLNRYSAEYEKGTEGYNKEGLDTIKKYVSEMERKYGLGMDNIVDETAEIKPEIVSNLGEAGTGGTNSLIGAIQGKLNQVGQASKGLAEIAEREYKNNINGDKLGSDTGAGVSGGLLSTIGAVGQAAKKVAEAAQKAYKDAQWQASPSKKFRQFGRFDVEGVILGYKDKLDDVESAAEEIAEAGRKPFEEQPEFSMDNIIIPEKFFGMGEDSAVEFARGFKDNLSDLMADVQLKIQSRLSAITPQVAYVGGASGNSNITYKTTTNSPTLIFNKQVDSPDVVAREVNKIFTFGLAGDR